ncbi:hypothetical protein PR048_006381 [Dryococelus australis]|uniref:Uncharacterized protein n=1 Tax=Dryococelus australis TaxID=614101 RepID=A0ABQ9IAT8_9NEOP|nr:hypothetical protein PR048_006381 [Dryococelus australis]
MPPGEKLHINSEVINKKKNPQSEKQKKEFGFGAYSHAKYSFKTLLFFSEKRLKIPLPGLSTLKGWASSFDMRKGIFASILQFLDLARSSLKDIARITVLSFYEVNVKKPLEYDSKAD